MFFLAQTYRSLKAIQTGLASLLHDEGVASARRRVSRPSWARELLGFDGHSLKPRPVSVARGRIGPDSLLTQAKAFMLS